MPGPRRARSRPPPLRSPRRRAVAANPRACSSRAARRRRSRPRARSRAAGPPARRARSRGRPCRRRRARASASTGPPRAGRLRVGLRHRSGPGSAASSTPGIIVGAMTAKLTASLRAGAGDGAGAGGAGPVRRVGDRPGGLSGHALGAGRTGRARAARHRARDRRRCTRPRSVARCASRSRAWPPTRRSASSRSCGRACPGDAWEGANRTLLYLLVFALFACWPQRGSTAALLLVAWTLAMIALAGFAAAARRRRAAGSACAALLPGGRLVYPTGYPNANAAQWLMAFWPAAAARAQRAPAVGAARRCSPAARCSWPRSPCSARAAGSLYATPVMLVLVFALLPGPHAHVRPARAGRGRDRGGGARRAARGRPPAAAARSTHVDGARRAARAPSPRRVAVGLVVALGAAIESRRSFSEASLARVRTGG